MHAGADGRDAEGKKELIGFQAGYRESEQSWKELLVDLKARGLADRAGAGRRRRRARLLEGARRGRSRRPASSAAGCTRRRTCSTSCRSRCSPRRTRSCARSGWRRAGRRPRRRSTFAEKYAPKYDKAVECLLKDRDTLLTFYDFPAEHWVHLRTTNPIESVFATVRHRTERTKGALSQDTAKIMVFKLIMAASKTWRRLKGQNQLPKLIGGVAFPERNRGRPVKPKPPLDPPRHPKSRIALSWIARSKQLGG